MTGKKTGTDTDKASAILREGRLVGIPTETVYGLGANALNENAVAAIFAAKKRPFFDPLIIHLPDTTSALSWATEIPDAAKKLAETFWPGPLTLVLKKKPEIPDLVTSGLDTVGIRVPEHPLTLELLSKAGVPVAAPSANPFGYISPTTAAHVTDLLGDEVDYVLDGGPCRVGLESTIVGFEKDGPVIYRLGGLPLEEIEKVAGKVKVRINQSSDPKAPGQLKSHYSPLKPLHNGNIEVLAKSLQDKKIGILSFRKDYSGVIPFSQQCILSPSGNDREAACKLFASMRYLDSCKDVDVILSEIFPETGLGPAINDRLQRAAE